MRSCAIEISLIAPIAVECVFWAEDDGWKGVCEDLSILVRGRDFKDSKEHMDTVLTTYVGSLFRAPANKFCSPCEAVQASAKSGVGSSGSEGPLGE